MCISVLMVKEENFVITLQIDNQRRFIGFDI